MGSKNNTTASVSLFLALNVLFFSLVTACDSRPKPSPNIPKPQTTPTVPTPATPSSSDPTNYAGKCPALKLGVCANILNLADVVVGSPPKLPCCSLIQGLVDLEAALCVCTAIKANILGINLNIPVALGLVLSNCGKKVPTGFECY